jgi:hypothetical protein
MTVPREKKIISVGDRPNEESRLSISTGSEVPSTADSGVPKWYLNERSVIAPSEGDEIAPNILNRIFDPVGLTEYLHNETGRRISTVFGAEL